MIKKIKVWWWKHFNRGKYLDYICNEAVQNCGLDFGMDKKEVASLLKTFIEIAK